MNSASIAKLGVCALMVYLSGCRSGPAQVPSIGEAFVGPVTLKLRSDIPLQSKIIALVKHGDRLEILQRRRRFLRVRAPNGAEGWTDERQLLGAEDMANLKDLASRAATMPVQGQGTSFGDLNVHTLPDRLSPSFLQVKEKEKVDVLGHMAAPRAGSPRKPLIPPVPKKAKKDARKSPKKEPKYPPLPLPKPPSPPSNWLELSKTEPADPQEEPAPEADDKQPVPVPMDSWSLIRTASGQSGWVLTRRLIMAIPDEVAQYAEGHRIVSYFPLAEVQDGDQKKRTWLWTTIASGAQPYDFDSFRVFVWSLRRHRYETAYIERNVQGYAPVLLQDVELSTGYQARNTATAKYPGFSICLTRSDGQRVRRQFALLVNIVRFAGEGPCEAPPTIFQPGTPGSATPSRSVGAGGAPLSTQPPPQPAESFGERLKKRLQATMRNLFGR